MTGAGMTGAGSAGGAEPVGPDGFTYCGNVSGLPEGALIGLRFKQLVIGRDNLGVYAMTSICTHKQCNMLADGGIIPGQVICGCHDSFFDAIGAVGIARTFATAQAMASRGQDSRFYHPEDPMAQGDRALDDRRQPVDHFFAKLLKLAATMHTQTAKTEGAERHRRMTQFLADLQAEIE